MLSDKETEAQVQTHPQSETSRLRASPAFDLSPPTLLKDLHETKKNDGAKRDLWGHTDLGSERSFTFFCSCHNRRVTERF